MSDQLNLFEPTICEASGSATSSPGSACGPMPSTSPDGRATAPSGQEAVPVSPSQALEPQAASKIAVICGRTSRGSSASADLSLYLASRLQARTALLGSTLFALTWKQRVTSSGRWIPALRALAL